MRPAQVKSELIELARLVHELSPKALLEIGTYNGGTFFVLCRVSDPCATVISLDLPGGKWGGGPQRFRGPFIKRLTQRTQHSFILRADSHVEASRHQVADILGTAKLDLLFVDGDHSYSGVKRDFEMYAPLVRKGGMIGFHDILKHPPEMECEVDRFWNEIKGAYPHREIVENRRQGWAGIGVLFV